MVFFEVVLTVIAILLAFLYYFKKDSRYPPGPRSIPFLGNVIQIGNDPLRVLKKWAEEYGSIYSIRMGTEDTIVLSDPKLVKELFSNANSTGRASNPVQKVFGGGFGIINAEGHTWESQRRFTLRKLRDFGVLKSSIEVHLMEEANTLIQFFERKAGKLISGTQLFNGAVVNALWRIVSGESNDWDSPNKPEILERAENVIRTINRTAQSGLFFAPSLRFVAPGYFGWTDWVKAVDDFWKTINQSVEQHNHKLDPNNPHDFIDHYLIEMREATDPSSTFYNENGENNLRAVLGDLFIAGSGTSSSTLSFGMLYLIQNKEAQRKAQQELDKVVGSSRQPSLTDKASLPYTEAVLLETLRMSTVLALGAPHRILADTMFHGYFLPKGVTVISNLYTISHDPKIWGKDANTFRPERFLNDDETEVVSNDALMPFSVGRRVCIGEDIAKNTIFLFLASILQKFDIESDPDCPAVDVEPPSGLIVEPKPFKFMVNLRKL